MVESEESENRDIGRDVLSKNRRSRMSILIFYYYSDLAIIGLFWSERDVTPFKIISSVNECGHRLKFILSPIIILKPVLNTVLHMSLTLLGPLSSCEVRRLTQSSSTGFIWIG